MIEVTAAGAELLSVHLVVEVIWKLKSTSKAAVHFHSSTFIWWTLVTRYFSDYLQHQSRSWALTLTFTTWLVLLSAGVQSSSLKPPSCYFCLILPRVASGELAREQKNPNWSFRTFFSLEANGLIWPTLPFMFRLVAAFVGRKRRLASVFICATVRGDFKDHLRSVCRTNALLLSGFISFHICSTSDQLVSVFVCSPSAVTARHLITDLI